MINQSSPKHVRALRLSLGIFFALAAESVWSDDGDSRSTATWILPGTRAASLSQGDYDYFRFRVTKAGRVAVYSEGFVDTRATLLDEGGNQIALDDQGAAQNNFFLNQVLSPGTYFIEVRSGYAISAPKTGDYRMTLRTQESAPFVDGSTFSGELTAGSVDFYRIKVDQVGLFETYTTGTTNTGGYVYNEVGTLVGSHDVQNHANFHFEREGFQPGTYLLMVRGGWRYSYSPPASGPYQGFVLRPSLAETLTEAPLDRSLDPVGDVDHFAFVVPEYGEVRVWSEGNLDTQMQLYDGVGRSVNGGYSNDSGVGYNFDWRMTLQPGRYLARVSAGNRGSRDPRETYRIRLDLPGVPKDPDVRIDEPQNPTAAKRRALVRQIGITKRALRVAKKRRLVAKVRSLTNRVRMLQRQLRRL